MVVEGCCWGFPEDGGVDVEGKDDETEEADHVGPDVASLVVNVEDAFEALAF